MKHSARQLQTLRALVATIPSQSCSVAFYGKVNRCSGKAGISLSSYRWPKYPEPGPTVVSKAGSAAMLSSYVPEH